MTKTDKLKLMSNKYKSAQTTDDNTCVGKVTKGIRSAK